ncbi:unnamed protein product, partial [marine sediment metagenome]
MLSKSSRSFPQSKGEIIGTARSHELSNFDGAKDHPVYVAFNNKIHDVSKSSFWKDGKHFGKHSAGTDLTGMLDQAPHGEEKL